jgi:prepilin-type N-terminal cleavage/methylation domain-containing protein
MGGFVAVPLWVLGGTVIVLLGAVVLVWRLLSNEDRPAVVDSAVIHELGALRARLEEAASLWASVAGEVASVREKLESVAGLQEKLSRAVARVSEEGVLDTLRLLPGWSECSLKDGSGGIALSLPHGRRMVVGVVRAGELREAGEVEQFVERRVRSVAELLESVDVVRPAVVVVPDDAYGVCGRAHVEAGRAGVVIVPAGLAVPYVLALHALQAERAELLDGLERLGKALEDIGARSADIQGAFGDLVRRVEEARSELEALRGKVSPPPRAQGGTTLIELLVALAIVALLAVLYIPQYAKHRARALVSESKGYMRHIATLVQAYAADHNDFYPQDIYSELVPKYVLWVPRIPASGDPYVYLVSEDRTRFLICDGETNDLLDPAKVLMYRPDRGVYEADVSECPSAYADTP